MPDCPAASLVQNTPPKPSQPSHSHLERGVAMPYKPLRILPPCQMVLGECVPLGN